VTARLAASIVSVLLLLPSIPSTPSSADSPAPAQPRIDWIGDRSPQDPNHIIYRDTDQDGLEEIIFWSSGSLSVYDPPSLKCVLSVDWLQDFEGPVFDDPGGKGTVRIIAFSSDYEGPSNFSVYSGSDFSLLWKSPNWWVPRDGSFTSNVHEYADIDGDGSMDFVWMANASGSANLPASIFVYNGTSFKPEWVSPPQDGLMSIRCENLDTDPALEIICTHWLYDFGSLDFSLDHLAVYDGATHALQWELPRKDGFRFNLRPLFQGPGGYYHEDRQDLDGDGVIDVVIEYRQTSPAGSNETGIRVLSGETGEVEWTAPARINSFELYSGIILNISDVDGDGDKELVVVPDPDPGAGNSTELRIYSGRNGTLEWSTPLQGKVFYSQVADLDADAGRELLLTEHLNVTDTSYRAVYEVFGLGERNRRWSAGPLDVSYAVYDYFSTTLFAQDILADGSTRLVLGNYSVVRVRNETGYSIGDLNSHSYQILDPVNFSVLRTSPMSYDNWWRNEMQTLRFDDASMPVLPVFGYDQDGEYRRNNTLGIYSVPDFRDLWKGSFPDGRLSVEAQDLVNDSRKELVVGIDAAGYGQGSENLFFVLDSRTFDILWRSPGTEVDHEPSSEMTVFCGNLTGGPGRELVFCNVSSGIYASYAEWTPATSVLAVYDDAGFREIWNSTSLDGEVFVLGARDFDYDGSEEVLLDLDGKAVTVEFPKTAPWAPGIRFPEPSVRITSPAAGARVGSVVTIAGTASDDYNIDEVWVDTQGYGGGSAKLVRSADNRLCQWSYAWDARGAMPGDHVIHVTATNLLGREAEANVTVRVPEPAGFPPLPATWTGTPDTTTAICITAVIVWAVSASALIIYLMLLRKRRKS